MGKIRALSKISQMENGAFINPQIQKYLRFKTESLFSIKRLGDNEQSLGEEQPPSSRGTSARNEVKGRGEEKS